MLLCLLKNSPNLSVFKFVVTGKWGWALQGQVQIKQSQKMLSVVFQPQLMKPDQGSEAVCSQGPGQEAWEARYSDSLFDHNSVNLWFSTVPLRRTLWVVRNASHRKYM